MYRKEDEEQATAIKKTLQGSKEMSQSYVQELSTGQYLELLLKDVNPVEFFDKPILITDGGLPVKIKGVYASNAYHYAELDGRNRAKEKAAAQEEHEEQIKEAREQLQDFIVKEKELGKNFL